MRNKKDNMYLFVSSSSDYLLHGSLFVYNFSDSPPLNMGQLTNLRVTNVISNFDIWFLMTRVLWSHIISNFSPPNTWLHPNIDCPQQTLEKLYLILSIFKSQQHYQTIIRDKPWSWGRLIGAKIMQQKSGHVCKHICFVCTLCDHCNIVQDYLYILHHVR